MRKFTKLCDGALATAMLLSPVTAMASHRSHHATRHARTKRVVRRHASKKMSTKDATNYRYGVKVGNTTAKSSPMYAPKPYPYTTKSDMAKLSTVANKSRAFCKGFLKGSSNDKRDLRTILNFNKQNKAYKAGWFVNSRRLGKKYSNTRSYYQGFKDSTYLEYDTGEPTRRAFNYVMHHRHAKYAMCDFVNALS